MHCTPLYYIKMQKLCTYGQLYTFDELTVFMPPLVPMKLRFFVPEVHFSADKKGGYAVTAGERAIPIKVGEKGITYRARLRQVSRNQTGEVVEISAHVLLMISCPDAFLSPNRLVAIQV